MKTTTLATLLLVGTTTAMPAAAAPAAAAVAPSASGTRFTIDGETKYFAGTNSYWISFLDSAADVDLVMDHLVESDLKILRVWGFNDATSKDGVYFQYLSSSGSEINTGASGLQRLDRVVDSAARKGVKLIINFVNFWDDYGGMNAYAQAFGGDRNGWYTNSAAQAQYRKYIAELVGRYKDSDGIFAWELANEPRCQGCDTSVIYEWAKSTSEYIKGLDSTRMVTLGDEGMGVEGDGSYPYQYGEGTDFAKNLEIDTLDFGTFHMYPSSWGVENDFAAGWIKAHGDACAAAGKPCLFEEYGTESNHCGIEPAWQKSSREANGMGGDLFWQWGDQLSSGQTHNDGHTVYYGSSDYQCMVVDHVAAIDAMP